MASGGLEGEESCMVIEEMPTEPCCYLGQESMSQAEGADKAPDGEA